MLNSSHFQQVHPAIIHTACIYSIIVIVLHFFLNETIVYICMLMIALKWVDMMCSYFCTELEYVILLDVSISSSTEYRRKRMKIKFVTCCTSVFIYIRAALHIIPLIQSEQMQNFIFVWRELRCYKVNGGWNMFDCVNMYGWYWIFVHSMNIIEALCRCSDICCEVWSLLISLFFILLYEELYTVGNSKLVIREVA